MMDGPSYFEHLEQSRPAPIYLFKSPSEFLVEGAWERLRNLMVPVEQQRWNGERLSADDISAEDVLTRIRTLPLTGGRRLLLVRHVERWSKEDRKTLEEYAANPVKNSCLVLTLSGKSSWKKLQGAIEKTGIVVQFKAPSSMEAPRWLRDRARKAGKQMDFQAATALVEQVGTDLSTLDQELMKVCTFVGERSAIKADDVYEVVSRQRTFTVFEVTRYIGQKRPDLAVASLRNLLLAGESPLPILGLLARHIRLIWQIKDATVRGQTLSDLQKRLRLPLGVIRQYTDQGQSFSDMEMRRIHQAIVETDLDLKRTSLSPERVLEALVLKLCQIADDR